MTDWTPDLPDPTSIVAGAPGHVEHTKALLGGITNLREHADSQSIRTENLEALTTVGRLSETELTTNFVHVRTSDGHPLAPSTFVVITLDKTLAQITANPSADIADITFEEA